MTEELREAVGTSRAASRHISTTLTLGLGRKLELRHTPILVLYSAGNFKQSIGDKNRVGIGLPYRPARLHRPAELIPWNRFLSSFEI
jgi:hypothetical protein